MEVKQGNDLQLSVSECNKYSLAQTWEKIQNKAIRIQICKKDLEKCLTVSEKLDGKNRKVSEKMNGKNRAVSLEKFVKGSENQLWAIYEKEGQLENVNSGLCLINVAIVSPFHSGIEARVCPENSVDKMGGNWSFVPLNNCGY